MMLVDESRQRWAASRQNIRKIFHAHTSHISNVLMEEQPPEEVAHEYVAQIRALHAELRQSCWAEA